MIRVLFVCLGNICRSPMAEAVLQHLVAEAGLSDRIEVDSAGTGGWHAGEPAHSGTRRELAKHGISYVGSARQLMRADAKRFDYILVMDHENLADVRSMLNGTEHKAEIRLFMEFAPELGSDEVPDPYYDGRFDEVYRLVHAAAAGLLRHIRQEHGL